MLVSRLGLLFSLMTSAIAVIPKGFIMDVQPNCGDTIEDDPYILVVTDLQAIISAECGNGVFPFNNTDTVNFYLPVSYRGRNSGLCEFIKRAHTHIYVVKIIISYGEPGQMISQDDEEYTVSCIFHTRKTQGSETQIVVDPRIRVPEIHNYLGRLARDSTVDFYVTDVEGNNITGEPINNGRYVQLKVETDGGSGEYGLIPRSCDLIGEGSGRKYSFLRAGCGDGRLLETDEGFNVTGLQSTSPFFRMVQITDDDYFSIECNFTLCEEECDGSSCSLARVRDERDADMQDGAMYIHLKTSPIFLEPEESAPDSS